MTYPKELQKLYDKLTYKQQKFVDLWDGDQENTARLAGFKGAKMAGVRCIKNVNICYLIKYAKDQEIKPHILSRQDRQKFWSDVVTGEIKEKHINKDGVEVELPQKMQDRLKASDLLGKSEGDFMLRHEVAGIDSTILQTILANLPPLYAQSIRNILEAKNAITAPE